MKNILITGASRGIGRAIAIELAEEGRELVLTGRDDSKLAETAKLCEEKNAQVLQITADLSNPEKVLEFCEKLGGYSFDVVVNNAGIAIVESLEDLKIDSWQKTFDVNVTAPFLITQKLTPKMPSGSSIVNILSVASKTGFSNWSSYCMSKHAVDGFAKSIRGELSEKGIRIINLYPGSTDTEIWDNVPGQHNLEKMMKPQAVAELVKSAVSQPFGTVVEDIVMKNLQ